MSCHGGPLIQARKTIHKTKAGSCKLSQLSSFELFRRITVSDIRVLLFLVEISPKHRDV